MGSMQDALRKAGVSVPAPEAPAEKACARCGKMFRPGKPQHKLCDECVALMRAERAAQQSQPASEPAVGEKTAGEETNPAEGAAAPAPPRARPERERPRRDRPVRAGEAGPSRRHGQAPGRAVSLAPARGLPGGYLEGGYFTSEGALRRELLTDWAEQIAQGVAAGPTETVATQIRAFYSHVRRAASALKFGRGPVEPVLNEIQKLKALAAERASRRKIPELFSQFLDANVDRVADRKTILAFAEHFQAVAAFASGLLHSRRMK